MFFRGNRAKEKRPAARSYVRKPGLSLVNQFNVNPSAAA
jgi:hypothetical protein